MSGQVKYCKRCRINRWAKWTRDKGPLASNWMFLICNKCREILGCR